MKRGLSLIALSVSLSACVAGPAPDIATPAPDLPQAFFYAGDADTAADVAQLLPVEDAAFRLLSQRMLEASPTLGEALVRIDAARAGAARAGAERLPSIGADAGVSATRTNPAQFGGDLPTGIALDTEQIAYSANLNARWDADIFGRLRAQERAALSRIDAATANAAGVRIALVAELAGSIIDWRSLTAREAALQEDLDAALNLARLAGVREEAGLAPGFDRVRAETTAAASRSRLAGLSSERARLIGRMITLTALPADVVRNALDTADTIDDSGQNSGQTWQPLRAAPTMLPSLLLTNRPDILRAAAELAAQDAELSAAARSRFPQFNLSAVVGLLAFSPGDLFNDDSIVGSLAAGLAAPLLDFGRVEAEIDRAAAEKRAAFAAYRQAVFTGLGDTEAAYGLIAAADAEYAAIAEERDSAQRAARLADTRYRAGLTDFLTVLEARRVADASAARAAIALGSARRARVLLWQAIGGMPSQDRPAIGKTADQNGSSDPSQL